MKYYPIILKNECIESFIISVSPYVEIRKISEKERERFFGIESIDFSFAKVLSPGYIAFNKIHSSKDKGGYDYGYFFPRGLFDGSNDIFASNYLLIIEAETHNIPVLVEQINLSFKLFKPTSTGAYLGFGEKGKGVSFDSRMPLAGSFHYLSIEEKDLETIKENLALIRSKYNHNKFKILSELYSKALEGGHTIPDFLRFILLIICLESLYLPNEHLELRFKFSLRIGKLLSKLGHGKAEEIYKKAQNLYDIRSDIVHQAKLKKFNRELFEEAVNITRLSILHFLKNEQIYAPDNLIKVCLD